MKFFLIFFIILKINKKLEISIIIHNRNMSLKKKDRKDKMIRLSIKEIFINDLDLNVMIIIY